MVRQIPKSWLVKWANRGRLWIRAAAQPPTKVPAALGMLRHNAVRIASLPN